MFKQKRFLYNLLITSFALTVIGCKAYKVNGYDYNIYKIGVDISNHHTEYLYPPNQLFLGSAQKQIDNFDEIFLANLNNKIIEKGYSINIKGEMQTLQLKDCLIEFNKSQPEILMKGLDSLFISELLTTIVCKQKMDTNSLFFASYKTDFNYDYLPINSFKVIPNDTLIWQFSKNYAYREIPFTEIQMQLVAIKLAQNTVQKIDTINVSAFSKKYPAIYQNKYKKNHPNTGGGLLIAMLALLIIVLIP